MNFRALAGGLVVTGGVAGLVISGVISGGSAPGCTTTISSGAISPVSGATICLNPGSFTLASNNYSFASMATIQAAAGAASRNSVVITGNVDLQNSNNLTLKDLTLNGALSIGANAGAGHPSNMNFLDVHYANCVTIRQFGAGQWNTTLDGGLADMSAVPGTADNGSGNECTNEGRFSIRGPNNGTVLNTSSVGLVIKNMDLNGNGKCTDAFQVDGIFTGLQIGPNNTIHDFQEGSCGAHVDAIQGNGDEYNTYTGNYLVNDSQMIDFFNSTHHTTITNNYVNSRTDYPAIWCGWCEDITVTHNTIVNNDIFIKDYTNGTDHDPQPTSGVIRDNVMTTGGCTDLPCGQVTFSAIDGSVPATLHANITTDFNLQASGTTGLTVGAHDVLGTPTLIGGSQPTSYAGAALSCPGHIGCGAASDGQNMGVNP